MVYRNNMRLHGDYMGLNEFLLKFNGDLLGFLGCAPV